jgi:putative inorganic carbon (hco3(-)) transporter
VTAFAALSGPLPKAGVVALAALVAVVLLASSVRPRAMAMLGALALAPVLLLADIWHSPQLATVHRHPLVAVGALGLGLAVLAGFAALIARRPALLGALVVLALPFRIPIQAGGKTSNLLVALYLVVGAGALAYIVPALRGRRPFGAAASEVGEGTRPGWVQRLLALYVVLYALQAIYSLDFEKALQQMAFFYVPFALMFCLLTRLRWSRQLLRRGLELVAGLSVLFALVAFVEYATKTIIFNPKLVVQNDLHAYFTVNSVFFDPDIFGRFLALVMILLVAVLLYARRHRDQLAATALLAILWAALVLTLSRSSLGALLLGAGTVAALRWRVSHALLVAGAVVALGVGAALISPTTFGLNQGLNGASSGRAGLVSGGIQMFGERPLWGYGSGAFAVEYRAHHAAISPTLAASHTIPITIAAEQGLIGELAYLALVLTAGVTLIRGARSDAARAAIAAAFLALVFHTLLYADFLEDPVAWTLLALGTSLAARRARPEEPAAAPDELATVAV